MRDRPNRWTCFILALAALLLTSCKKNTPPAMIATSARMTTMAAGTANTDQHIAISQTFALEVPGNLDEAIQQKNLTDCLAAGCTILGTHIDRLRNGVIQASISVRIAPDRYNAFATAITAPPATLVSHTETAEDKTVPLLDIEKRLDAQTALRDRLSKLQQQAGTDVGDLVTIEKQLADVQGTIESETAQRDYLRTITDTVKVDVSYNGVVQQAGSFVISPIRIALDDFLHILIESLATMIVFVATALPWLPLAALAGWILHRWLQRWLPPF